ncbi:MAG: hypothetical protein EZS28_045374 [Streblomastix strix]|uniref:Uncharacterized protein n=1 Tax=Streblomastix strix TaxID=222440 RepID=A0A5J4TMA4_9EUKA|nr:MAG: hypothetical protein EZS28_045374 [Streblomastix strix]
MVEHHMACDKEESKLLMLSSTHNEFKTFNNYYLWFLIDRCHLVIDEIQQVITYSKNTSFHEFVNETHKLRCEALTAGNKNLELEYKIKLNASFGYDALNTEKFQDIRICNRQKLGMCHMLNTFMSERYLSDNLSVVELEKRKCQCSTPLQVAYFVMDNSKYFYLNTFYNFLVPCLDMNKIHVIYGDTDSLCLAIADNNWPILNQKLWNKLYPQFFPMSDQIDEKKKLLGWNIEHQVKSCFALAPKCYYLDTYDNGEIMKLKGVNQQQNPNISRNSFIKNIQDDYHTEVTRKSVIQKKGLMSEVISNRVGISGINTKTIVLKNQACAPLLYGINADKYFVDESH